MALKIWRVPKLYLGVVAVVTAVSCEPTPAVQRAIGGREFKITDYRDSTLCEGKDAKVDSTSNVGDTLSFSRDETKDGEAFKGILKHGAHGGGQNFTWKVVETGSAKDKTSTVNIYGVATFPCTAWKLDQIRKFDPSDPTHFDIDCEKEEGMCTRRIHIKTELLPSTT